MMALNLELLLGILAAFPAALLLGRGAVAVRFPVTPMDARFGHVDGLRGVIALMVVCHHFVIWTYVAVLHRPWEPPEFALFNNMGKGAVAIFFMITGAVFYPRIAAGWDRVKWPKLYISRVFRILPLSFCVFAIAAISSAWIMGGINHTSLKGFTISILNWISGRSEPPIFGYYRSEWLNADVMWSLKYEWLFYLILLPSLAAFTMMLRGRAPGIAVPLCLLAGTLALRLVKPGSDLASFVLMFSVGMLVSETRTRPAVRRFLSGRGAATFVTALTLGCMIFFRSPYHLVLLSSYALLLLTAAIGNSFFGLLSSRSARALGDASFSIYMLHGFVLFALVPSLLGFFPSYHPAMWLPLIIVVVVTVSFVSYIGLERPLIEIGQRVGHWRPAHDRSLSVEAAP